MSSKLLFKLVVEDDGKEIFSKPLSYAMVSSIVSDYDDNEENNDLFLIAAKHPASTVREYIACKDKISEETLNLYL